MNMDTEFELYLVVSKANGDALDDRVHTCLNNALAARSKSHYPNDYEVVKVSQGESEAIPEKALVDTTSVYNVINELFNVDHDILKEVLEKYCGVIVEEVGWSHVIMRQGKDYRNHFSRYGLLDDSLPKDPFADPDEDEE
jgi:hypothetical protein